MKQGARIALAAGLAFGLFVTPVFAAKQNTSSNKEAKRKLIEEKKQELNGSQWDILLTPSADAKSRPQEDTLTFQNGQISSKILKDKGFKPTNYTITVEDGAEMSIWETMQTSDKEGLVFIRGEWKDKTMRGIWSQQKEGKNVDFSFTTAKVIEIPKTTAKAEEPAAPAEAVVPEASQAPASESALVSGATHKKGRS